MKVRSIIFYFSLFTFLLLSSCNSDLPKTKALPAFYHWQTHLKITPSERLLLDSLNVKKLYVKFFDIDLDGNGGPAPQALVQMDTHLLHGLDIVPTIFITNRTFKSISKKEIETLAENIFDKINALHRPPSEYQFDCDWTKSTRENYFYFLKYFNSQVAENQSTINNQQSTITSTIRLHQLKYPDQTGVPPVDRGMLMFYNMGDLDNWETENSILDLSIAEKYLPPTQQSTINNQQYPIPLDIALPIFKWGVVFRNGELVYLINNLGEQDLRDTIRFVKLATNRYEVRRSTYLAGYYLYGGDLVRLEGVGPELLENAGAMLGDRFTKLSKFSKPDAATITFYHLDTAMLKTFDCEDFKRVLEEF